MGETRRLKEAKGADQLQKVKDQFKRWRETRVRGEHIPAELWLAAQSLVKEYDVQQVAQALGIDGERLRKRLTQGVSVARGDKSTTPFVELTVAPPPASSFISARHDCVVELENGRGAKMRVELNAQGLAGLAGLCHAFWNAP